MSAANTTTPRVNITLPTVNLTAIAATSSSSSSSSSQAEWTEVQRDTFLYLGLTFGVPAVIYFCLFVVMIVAIRGKPHFLGRFFALQQLPFTINEVHMERWINGAFSSFAMLLLAPFMLIAVWGAVYLNEFKPLLGKGFLFGSRF